jgi:hypothetical protein
MSERDLIEPTIRAWQACSDPAQKQSLAEDILDFLGGEYEEIRQSGRPGEEALDRVLGLCPRDLREDLIHLVGLEGRFDQAREIAEREAAPLQATARIECTIKARIGRGGQAIVYEAESRSPHRLVAVKVPRGDSSRLLREARVLAKLDHAAVVPLFGRGVDDLRRNVIVLRRLGRETLADLIIATHSSLADAAPSGWRSRDPYSPRCSVRSSRFAGRSSTPTRWASFIAICTHGM